MTSSQIINTLQQSIDLVERYAQCILKNNSETVNLNELKSLVLNFTSAIETIQGHEKLFDKFIDTIDSSSEELDETVITERYSEEINAFDKSNQKPNDRYTEFSKLIEDKLLNRDDDDDIITESQTVNFIDPILKLPIIEPVKNKRCGHVYEKSTIIQLIATNRKTKCPIPGCTAIDYVKKSDLIFDSALKRMLSNISKNN